MSDIDTAVVDSLKVLDPGRPIREADYAACPPAGSKVTSNQVVLIVAEYLKSHPDQLSNNFHQLAVGALAAAWPCAK